MSNYAVAAFCGAVVLVMFCGAFKISSKPRARGRIINGDLVGGDYDVGGINISGRRFEGRDVTIINDKIYVDGVEVTNDQGQAPTGIVRIEVEGDVRIVQSDRAVNVKGNVNGNATSGGSMSCGDISGNAQSHGSMSAGNIGGDAKSGGSMSCGKVSGSAHAGGSMRHG